MSDPAGASPVELIVRGEAVVPMGGDAPIDDGAVAVGAGRIVEVGPAAGVLARHAGARVVGGRGRVVAPGMVDAHVHASLVAVRGLALGPGNPVYDVMWPMEGALDAATARDLARLGLADCLLSGTTTVNDHYFFAHETAEAAVDLGIGAVVGHTVMTHDGPRTGPDELAAALALLDGWAAHDLVRPCAAPHAVDTVADEVLVELAEAARGAGVIVHLHLAQTEREVGSVRARTGRSPVAHLDHLGLLDRAVVAAHCTYVDDDDIALLARAAVVPVYCPTVHAHDGRVLRAAELHRRGSAVAIGTDAAPTHSRSVLAEAAAALAGQSQLEGRRAVLDPATVLGWATTGNAAAVGLGDTIGRLAPGFRADLISVRTDTAGTAPAPDPHAALLAAGDRSAVADVWVAGRHVVRDGVLASVDEASVVAAGTAAARTLRSAAARH